MKLHRDTYLYYIDKYMYACIICNMICNNILYVINICIYFSKCKIINYYKTVTI